MASDLVYDQELRTSKKVVVIYILFILCMVRTSTRDIVMLIDSLIAWLMLLIKINGESWIDWLIKWFGTFCLIDRLIDWCIALTPWWVW